MPEFATPYNHARISNNLNKEFIMMTKFTTIYLYRQRSFVSAILFHASAQSQNNSFGFRATGKMPNNHGCYAKCQFTLDRDY